MVSYDEIINFDYTNLEEWKEFVKTELIPLNNLVLQLINLRKYFRQLSQIEFKELFENNQNIQEIFLGGINKEGEYNPNSLAKLYKDTIGIYINIKDWIAICKEKGIDSISYIECNYNNPNFYEFIKEINKIIDNLLKIIGEKPSEISKEDINRFLNNPEILLNDLKEIFPLIVNLSANCNYKTFFLLNTRNIPRYYIELAHPKIKSEFKELSRFLGLESKFLVELTENNRDYTIWGHKNNGFADLLYILNDLIWSYFDKLEYVWENAENKQKYVLSKSLGKVGKIVNLKEKYFNKVLPFLKNLNVSSTIISLKESIQFNKLKIFECKECNKIFNDPESYAYKYWSDPLIYDLHFEINYDIIKTSSHTLNYCKKAPLATAGKRAHTQRTHDDGILLLDLVKNISPLLFLDVVKLEFNEKEIIIKDRCLNVESKIK